jgi:membrane protease YdiL (CAAX protease family)
MSSEPLISAHEPPQAGSFLGRLTAILEVLLAFSLVHLAYRSFKHFTKLGRLEEAAGLNFSPGTAMILFTVGMLLVSRRSFERYGLSLKGWKYNLNIGLLWAVLIVLAAGVVVESGLVQFDPLHPPDLNRAAVFSLGEVIVTVVLIVFLLRERSWVRHIPPFVSLVILLGLVSLPVALAILFHRSALTALLRVLWLFFGAGFGEEIFFRGYIQSRVNQSFGRPWHILGLQFGVGLILSSLLFGFIHALNTVDYFSGRLEFAWLWWGTNFVTGLFFGCLRERTESILPGAIIHGLQDVLAEVPGLLAQAPGN